MNPTDRRTFLKRGVQASGLVAASSVLPELEPGPAGAAEGHRRASLTAAAAALRSSGPHTPGDLTVNGLTEPQAIGVDPDALWFAWRVDDPRRGAVQSAYRVQVLSASPAVLAGGARTRSGPSRTSVVWDSGVVHSAQQAFVAYGGAALTADQTYELRIAVADDSGAFGPSASTTFTTGLRDADWEGLWLQSANPAQYPEIYRYLRTSRALPSGTIVRGTAYVAGAHKYRLFVNGTQVDSGPSFSYPDESYYQATDVTGQLRAGTENVVGVLHHWYGPGKGRPTSAPGFLAHVAVHYSDGRQVVIASDGSWKELPGEWLPAPLRNNTSCDFVEHIDGRLSPLGWSTASYDDSAWAPVTVLGPVGTAPFTALYAQRTRILETEVRPVSVRRLESGAVVVDFGKVYAARPTVEFRHGISGRTIPMRVGYLLDPDGHVSAVHGTQGTNLSFTYIQRDGEQRFVPYTYIGFRYFEIDDPGETISAGQAVALARRTVMPMGEAAAFTSDNETLDEVYDMCTHSCAFTSQEQFVDTPTREKGPFLWDGSQEAMAVMRTFADQNLSFQGLRDFARSQARFWPNGNLNGIYPNSNGAQNYPTFTGIYAEWVYRYWLSTGDLPTMESLYPTLQRVASYFWSFRDPTTGVLTGIVEQQEDDPVYGFDFNIVVDTPVNVLAVNSLNRIATIANVVGDQGGAATYRANAAELTDAVNQHLLRPDGIYVDGLQANGALSPDAAQVSNILPLAYGLVPKERVATVGDYVRSLKMSTSVDHGLQLLQALQAAGLFDSVVHTLTDPNQLGWANILRQGATFCWEVWQPSDTIGDGMSHGWGSSAVQAIQEYLLGVALQPPTTPGTATVSVAPPVGPRSAGLNRASGTVPTVAGPISVNWRSTKGGRGGGVVLQIEVPANVTAEVTVPGSSPTDVTEGGKPIHLAAGVSEVKAARGQVTMTLGGGRYSIVST